MTTHHPYTYKVGHNFQAATEVDGERAANAGRHRTKAEAEKAAQGLADLLNSVWFEVDDDDDADRHLRRAFHRPEHPGVLLIADARAVVDGPKRWWVGIQEHPETGLFIAGWRDTEDEAKRWADAAGEVTWDHLARWQTEVVKTDAPALAHRAFQKRLRDDIEARINDSEDTGS